MIKEKDFEPGRVLTQLQHVWTAPGGEGLTEVITAWMVIGFQANINRRHKHKTAPRRGWDVVLIRFGVKDVPVVVVNFTPQTMSQWKKLF